MSICVGVLHLRPVYIGSILEHDEAGPVMVSGTDDTYSTLENRHFEFFLVQGLSGSSYKLSWPKSPVNSIDCF